MYYAMDVQQIIIWYPAASINQSRSHRIVSL